jgi:hypothetical protein
VNVAQHREEGPRRGLVIVLVALVGVEVVAAVLVILLLTMR